MALNRNPYRDDAMLTLDTPKALITVKGVLIPVAWAPGGDITAMAVATFDEKEFRLTTDDACIQWQELLSCKVSASGIPFEQDGVQWLRVCTLQPIDA
jgi:hypothetical protein